MTVLSSKTLNIRLGLFKHRLTEASVPIPSKGSQVPVSTEEMYFLESTLKCIFPFNPRFSS